MKNILFYKNINKNPILFGKAEKTIDSREKIEFLFIQPYLRST